MQLPVVQLILPDWLNVFYNASGMTYSTAKSRMELAIELSRLNVEHHTGGPFGAAIFDEQGTLVAPGINLVERSNCSLWHAEMVAIALAQTRLGRFDLSSGGSARLELVSSAEPCAMCLGAIPWSGVASLVCGAQERDAINAGFDEGAKPTNWPAELEIRGISVQRDLLREQAASVLGRYSSEGRTIYNPKITRL